MKRQFWMIGMLAAVSCAGLWASEDIVANVPFDFTLGKAVMPAGEYRVTLSNGTVSIREMGGTHQSIMLSRPARANTRPAALADNQGVLVFQRYGEERFLTTVWTKNLPDGRQLPESAQQKELARRAKPAEATTLAFSKK
jgi:hypothetical protein